MLVKGLAAGAYVIGLLFTLTLFALVVYGVCCLFAWAFGEEDGEFEAEPPAFEPKVTDWNEIEARFNEKKKRSVGE